MLLFFVTCRVTKLALLWQHYNLPVDLKINSPLCKEFVFILTCKISSAIPTTRLKINHCINLFTDLHIFKWSNLTQWGDFGLALMMLGVIQAGLVWHRIGTIERLLWTGLWTFRFHKMFENSWVAGHMVASQEELSHMVGWLVSCAS